MKKLKFLVIAIAAVISTLLVQNVYAADEYSISYTVATPVAGETMPTKVNATISINGEVQGTQELNLFWYESKNSSFKKADYTKFKPGKTYRPSVVDVNFTVSTYNHNGYIIETPGSAYSNCAITGKGTNVETGSSHLSNAFGCDHSLTEVINGESGKSFAIEKGVVSEVNVIIDTEIAGTESLKGEGYECSKYNDLTSEWEDTTCYDPATLPSVSFEKDALYSLPAPNAVRYVIGLPSMGSGYNESYFGTFEEGKDYYVSAYIMVADGYNFADQLTIKVNGKTTGVEIDFRGSNSVIQVVAKITATKKKEETKEIKEIKEEKVAYKVLDGDNQEFESTSDKPLAFRFNIDYSKFLASGKVFVDGKLTDPKNYDSAEGSTIITLKKEFTDTLAAGKHTVTVAVDDGEVSGTFTIAAKESVPKTLDNIEWSVAVCVLSVTALIGTAIYTKKKSFN